MSPKGLQPYARYDEILEHISQRLDRLEAKSNVAISKKQ